MKLDGTNMDLGNMSLTLRKQALDTPFTKKKTISDTYAEYAKLVFLFDVSGSMNSYIARTASGDTFTDEFVFTPEILADIRIRVGTAVNEMTVAVQSDNYDAITSDIQTLCQLRNAAALGTDEELKEAIVRKDLTHFFGIQPDPSKKHQTPPTRIELVKRLAKQEILNRFKKFPKSRIAVVPFGDQPITLFDDGDPDKLEVELDRLTCNGMTVQREDGSHDHTGGGTDILKAIRRGMDICRNKPSSVGIHHFILVTDGEDGAASGIIPTWVPAMKASGIVLDYIHIGDSYVNDGLRDACIELGGDFVVVNTEKDLSEKFQLAMNRLCLPPAATA